MRYAVAGSASTMNAVHVDYADSLIMTAYGRDAELYNVAAPYWTKTRPISQLAQISPLLHVSLITSAQRGTLL